MTRILSVQHQREAANGQQAGAAVLRGLGLCSPCEHASVPDVAVAALFGESDEASQLDVLAAELEAERALLVNVACKASSRSTIPLNSVSSPDPSWRG